MDSGFLRSSSRGRSTERRRFLGYAGESNDDSVRPRERLSQADATRGYSHGRGRSRGRGSSRGSHRGHSVGRFPEDHSERPRHHSPHAVGARDSSPGLSRNRGSFSRRPPFVGSRGLNFNMGDRGRGRPGQRNSSETSRGSYRGIGRGNHQPVEPMNQRDMIHLVGAPPEEVLLKLMSFRSGFVERICSPCSPDTVPIILELLARACGVEHNPCNLTQFLQQVNHSGFLVTTLVGFLSTMVTSSYPDEASCMYTCKLLRRLIMHLPSASNQNATVLLSQLAMLAKSKAAFFTEELQAEIRSLAELQKDVVKQIQGGELLRDQEEGQVKDGKDEGPPDDFRQLPVIPTSEDLVTDIDPYLRKNIIHGQYKDLDQYIDIHFRLLREDFLQPLRNGIKELIRNRGKAIDIKLTQDVNIYTGVHFFLPHCSPNGMLMRLKFDIRPLSRVKWNISKRLINGSLFCISKDKFQTFVLGTVANRDPDNLKRGYVDVELADVQNLDPNPYTAYEMIESQAYFEAYRHNLEGLQELDMNKLPFQQYLLNTKTDMVPPAYLRGQDVKFDFEPLVPREQRRKFQRVSILDKKTWPTAEDMRLDESQYRALQMAVTSEFSAIQGPPGTGKTFIGLKIVELLLHNASVWNEAHTRLGNLQPEFLGRIHGSTPILLICFTNHALDQFVEGILENCKGVEERVIRVGGRSSSTNPKLQDCLMRNVKKKVDIPSEIRENQFHIYERMNEIEAHTVKLMEEMVTMRHSIHSLDKLRYVIRPEHMRFFSNANRDIVRSWLSQVDAEMLAEEETMEEAGPDEADAKQAREADDFGIDPEMQRINDIRDTSYGFAYEENERIQVGSRSMEHLNKVTSMLTAGKLAKQVQGIAKQEGDNRWKEVTAKNRDKRIMKREAAKLDQMDDMEVKAVTDVWKLTSRNRWRLYRHWVSKLCDNIVMRMKYAAQQFNEQASRLQETKEEANYKVMSTATVLAMTTTGAAKHRRVLQRIKPRIVVVEEAAEVLESHIVTSLSADCQHLILIGDHQQLRPNPTVYRLAKDYHLDISLFERMVKNNLQCERLQIQHRMRPEIVKLIVPHVYKSLENHPSVSEYDDVRGIGGNMFLLKHTELENKVEDTRSRSNTHEASLLVALYKYLVQQDYKPEQITILTTYTGQMFEIRKILRERLSEEMSGVHVTPVDNYQGEENDIVLLSLVRSNMEGRIGFLNVSNRVCVALSRARKGFYAVGNIAVLRAASRLWDTICKEMEEAGQLVERIPLQCQLHPDTKVLVSCAEDFQQAPEGGCTRPCEARLACGHVCAMQCHPRDREHKKYECKKPCDKIFESCEAAHECTKYCYEPCGKCPVKVEKIIPKCGHIQSVRCSLPAEEFQCTEPCEKIVSCGHFCSNICGVSCIKEKNCEFIIDDREWPCGHVVKTHCHNKPENFPCPEMVEITLKCGHLANVECGRKHLADEFQCNIKVEVFCPRGCLSEIPCFKAKRTRIPCHNMVEKTCASNPDHKFHVLCDKYDGDVCTYSCSEKLPCGHVCPGTCGTCHEVKGHELCQEICGRFLPCGHPCQGKCGQPCQPCGQRCMTYCGHQVCRKRCSDPCWRCSSPCLNGCQHSRCTRPCPEPCNRAPCQRPCPMLLMCRHRCPGFCGEMCPYICPKCKEDIYRQMYDQLGIQQQGPRGKVVVLQPCYHVVDANYMDARAEQCHAERLPREVQLLTCPLCGSPVTLCNRYKTTIQSTTKALNDVKLELQVAHTTFAGLANRSTEGRQHVKLVKLLNTLHQRVDESLINDDLLVYYLRCIGCLSLYGATRLIKVKFNLPMEEPTGLVDMLRDLCCASVDHVKLRKLVASVKANFLLSHIEAMIQVVKHRFKLDILRNLRSSLRVTDADEALCERVNAELKGNIPLNLRNHVQDFVEEMDHLMAVSLRGSVNSRWMLCTAGHAMSASKVVPIETAAQGCGRCRLAAAKDDDHDYEIDSDDDSDDARDDDDDGVVRRLGQLGGLRGLLRRLRLE